ncbi:MAG: spore germination protein GerW family protein [Actinomycetota bacterium]|nr:spore germination protein GerW family protein [Actinomycetota bacterium]
MSEYKDIIRNIVSEVKETNVEAIFGEARQMGGQTIIPVGKISYGWGGGGGKGKTEDREQEGEGSGVGMGVNVKPIGYIDVTPEGASYRPIVDFAPLVAVGAGVLGLTALKLVHHMTKRKAA